MVGLSGSRAPPRESHRERGDNLCPLCVLNDGMPETSNADRLDAVMTW